MIYNIVMKMKGRPGQTRPLAKKKEQEENDLRRKTFGEG